MQLAWLDNDNDYVSLALVWKKFTYRSTRAVNLNVHFVYQSDNFELLNPFSFLLIIWRKSVWSLLYTSLAIFFFPKSISSSPPTSFPIRIKTVIWGIWCSSSPPDSPPMKRIFSCQPRIILPLGVSPKAFLNLTF